MDAGRIFALAHLWALPSLITFFTALDPDKGWARETTGRVVFWTVVFAPFVWLFFLGWGLARLLGYLFFLRKSL